HAPAPYALYPLSLHDALPIYVGAVDEVVGDVEQPADEHLVAGDAFGHPGLTVTGVGQLLAEEPALRTDRHDHGVLHHLRLHQTEDRKSTRLNSSHSQISYAVS